ncbi:MAG: hypothetical protein ACOX1N_06035 [Candidatus Methanomethylophilaceae archaeon]
MTDQLPEKKKERRREDLRTVRASANACGGKTTPGHGGPTSEAAEMLSKNTIGRITGTLDMYLHIRTAEKNGLRHGRNQTRPRPVELRRGSQTKRQRRRETHRRSVGESDLPSISHGLSV